MNLENVEETLNKIKILIREIKNSTSKLMLQVKLFVDSGYTGCPRKMNLIIIDINPDFLWNEYTELIT